MIGVKQMRQYDANKYIKKKKKSEFINRKLLNLNFWNIIKHAAYI